jgi:hypothetical protein
MKFYAGNYLIPEVGLNFAFKFLLPIRIAGLCGHFKYIFIVMISDTRKLKKNIFKEMCV